MPSQQHPELFVQPLILSITVASSTRKAWGAMPELGDGERPCHCHRHQGQLQAHARGGRGCSLCGNCCWEVEAEAHLCSSNEPCSGGSDWRVGNHSPPGLSVAHTAFLLPVTRCHPCSPPLGHCPGPCTPIHGQESPHLLSSCHGCSPCAALLRSEFFLDTIGCIRSLVR